MTTRSRPTATAAQLVLLREAEATVQVARPYVPGVPQSVYVSHRDRTRWVAQRAPTQACRVSYRVWSDPVMLADLAARSLKNKSREAIRGWAVARAGHVDLGMDDKRYEIMAAAAANRSTLRAVEGPVVCKAKLLDKPEPFLPACVECKQSLADHERVEETLQGAMGEVNQRGYREWDMSLTRVEVRWYCPKAQS